MRLSDGTLLTGPQWSYMRLLINNTYDIPRDNYCIEFDVIDTNNTSTNVSLNLYDGTSHNIYLLPNIHYKIIISDKIYTYANDVALIPLSYDSTKTTFQVQFSLRNNDITLTFRNFIMYTL